MAGTHTVGPLAGRGGGLFAIWGRLDRTIERTFDTRDSKSDEINAFLPDPVLEFTGESGEVRGPVRTHPPSRD